MNSIINLKERQSILKATLAKALNACKQLGSQHKHATYKAKRLDELEEIWQEFEANDKLIEERGDVSDEEYDKIRREVDAIYDEYYALLEKIPTDNKQESDNESEDESSTHTGSPEEELARKEVLEREKLIKGQQVRFSSFLKICEQIITKKNTGEPVSSSFGKIKITLINSSWERIATGHEMLGSTGKYTREYKNQMIQCETAMEESLLFLQEIMDKSNKNDGVKLERVTIPKFNGDYFKWVTFRDLFVSLVINNKTLSKAQQLQMLKTNLNGEPEYLISDLTISDVNFDAAWGRLTHRYENNRVVVAQHLNKLVTQAPGKWEAKSLKKLLDTTDQILLALRNLGRPTEHWDDWIVFIISQKFTEDCRKDWEKKIGTSTDLPTWDTLKKFLEEEFRMLEGVENTQRKPAHTHQPATTTKSGPIKVYQTTIEQKGCAACGKDHRLFSCIEFKKMLPTARWDLAKKSKLCFACLKPNHDKGVCTFKKPCKHCARQHSTWLHEDRRGKSKETNGNTGTKENEVTGKNDKVIAVATMNEQVPVDKTIAVFTTKKQVLLATALVVTTDVNGQTKILRALIDSGAQGSLITSQAAALLQHLLYQTKNEITPLGETKKKCLQTLTLTIRPHFNSWFECAAEFYVMPKLTRTLPDEDLNIQDWNHLRGLQLADPTFNKVGPIDILLGADIVSEIMKEGLIKGTTGQPMAQSTEFGWIVSGKIDITYQKRRIQCMVATVSDNNYDLQKFWELEELNPKRALTQDEEQCEKLYQETIQRNSDGSYIAKIPFKENSPQQLGTSRHQCLARFHHLERKFSTNADLKKEYCHVMEEYIQLGHMKQVDHNTEKLYYIPHHAVIKPDSLTTKTRVVFDASARTSTGKSLNDCMFIGAKQQKDLFEILTKWRKHKVVFKADIEKMYRKIHIDELDQRYHTIFWRKNREDDLKEYQLQTVTFGTAAAPFLATRTLKQIAMDHKMEFPTAAEIIENDFYVDDLVSGCETVTAAIKAKDELIQCLDKAKFTLRKWTSNNQELLDTLPQNITEKSLQLFADETTKALGLQWNPRTDKFGFQVSWNVEDGKITKRNLFSEASKLFDPLGWLAPTVINAKLFMQEVWASKISWDEEVSEMIKEKWTQFRNELPLLGQISVDRWIQYRSDCEMELHGFCDASEKAYAAVVYTRIKKGDEIEIKLITSKTRVAPLSTKTTLPRLELCGAVLLSHLLKAVKESFGCGDVPVIAWSDSMITLAWLQGTPHKWKTFVGNRVSEVHATKITDWRYIRSEDNPADCASRGIMPHELKGHVLWWEGPAWLKEDPSNWPICDINADETDDIEQRTIVINVATIETNEHVERASSWSKLIRVTAYCLRMKKRYAIGPALTSDEQILATNILIKQCQREAFPEETQKLINGKPLLKSSRLLQLDPFLDDKGIMRVGGRLHNAPITFQNRHPAILPQKHKVTTLIIRQMHEDTLHGGPQLMLGLIRKKYWILNAKRKITDEVKKCVTCKRMSSQMCTQQMGILPKHRVSLARAFLHSGVDYAGPFDIKTSSIRNAKIQKAYIAVFVCFGTKAFHLELVSDQTTEAFLAAFNRFMARRGLCETMYSDNGGNFVKAASWLDGQQKVWLHQRNLEIKELLGQKGIQWNFIPPGSPNHGGLWERGVKSVKGHLKRTLKTACLTFEEYATVLCQVEACLNSRPLCPLTNDVENLNALTPGHFLIGDALMAPPQQVLLDNKFNKVNRWRHLQLLQQHFWNRWHKEYLHQLQQRQKWKTGEENLKKGDIVLLKDEDMPPRNWLMGRIAETYPGIDGKVRIVSVRTHTNSEPKNRKTIIMKRSVRKLCLLVPEDTNQPESENQVPSRTVPKVSNNVQQNTVQQKGGRKSKPSTARKPVRAMEDQPSTSQQVKYNTRSKRINRATIMLALISFAILLGGVLAQPQPVQNTEFKHNSGIYFEDLGRAKILRSTWNIYVHFELTKYYQEAKMLQETTETLQQMCATIDISDTDDHCHEITTILREKVAEIKMLNTLIKTNGEAAPEPTIKKRILKRAAPLNIVGWIQHELFGIMAADQAEHIEEQIHLAKENGRHVVELIKRQTTVVENTVNLVKRTQDDINASYTKINSILEQLQNDSSDTRKKDKIMGLALYTSLLINRFEKVQQSMLDLITDVQQGHISSYVFTPQQLKEQVIIINNNLPPGTRFFEEGQHDLKSLYKMMHSKTRVTDKNILVHISIPLVSVLEYQLYHIIPLPTKHQGSYVSIVPESKYMMITLKKDSFYQISEKEFNTCVKPGPRVFICGLKHPLYNSQSGRSQCERDLLEQKPELSHACKFNITKEEDFWMQLHEKNNWIYSLAKTVQLNIVCDNQLHTITLKEAGIIQLGPGCEAVQPGMTITAESDKTSEGSFKFIPTLDLSKTMIRSGQERRLQLINTTIDHSDQFKLIHDQIQDLKTQSNTDYIHHSTHHGMDIFITVTLISLVIFIWLRRHWISLKIRKWYTMNGQNDAQENGDNQDGEKQNQDRPIHLKCSDDKQDQYRPIHLKCSDDNKSSVDKQVGTSSTVGIRHVGENVQSGIRKDSKLYHSLRREHNLRQE